MEHESFLDGLWYFACPAAELAPGAVKALTIAGRPLALARRLDGTLYALRDICPHRGMPLSFGRVAADGTLECPYHGWRFNGAGRCSLIPSLVEGQDIDIGRIGVDTYPISESQGMIWIATGPLSSDASAPPLLPDMGAVTPNLIESQIFACHIDHAVIGLMDPAHGPFVHQSWWWRDERSIHHKKKRFVPSLRGFTMASHAPSKNSAVYRILGGEKTTEISFQLPGIRIETIRAGKSLVNILTAVTPIDATSTRVTSMLFWDLHGPVAILGLFKPLIALFTRRFLGQDRDAVVKQQVGLKHDPKLMLINDADTQARWYFQIKHLWAESRRNGTAFTNPIKECVLEWRS
jgi:phenylpropionate dioxygenase-like ring-hydroxylating dioxygenase large terminal subunit